MTIVRVDLGARAYEIHIGPAARQSLAAHLSADQRRRVVIVADEQVADLHLAALTHMFRTAPIVLRFPPGEASKSLRVAESLYGELAAAGVARDDLLITFGGGVAGDLGGFLAATWQRGMRFIQIPTTLEAAIDASIGGKTAINHDAGKNLIGAFHQPAAVLIDTDFLATLPQRELVAALAESVKHAVIRDADFLSWHEQHVDAVLSRDPDKLTTLIARNCAIKARVVEQDEREAELRMILNFGHTIGHALEHLLHYELRHGECVALGMLAANRIASARGLLSLDAQRRVADLLQRFGLPQRLPRPIAADHVVEACRRDKKVRAGRLNFILLSAIAAPHVVADVADGEIAVAIEPLQPA